ncbi:unnamed protein product [Mortierella alpina]
MENIGKHEQHRLETMFLGADEDGNGLLTTEKILRVVMSENTDIPEEDFRLAIAGFQYDQDVMLDLQDRVARRMRSYLSHTPRLRTSIMSNVKADLQLTEDELQKLTKAFKDCDKNKDGRITTIELIDVFSDMKRSISRDEAEEAVKKHDADKDRGLNFQEVCSLWATLHLKKEA